MRKTNDHGTESDDTHVLETEDQMKGNKNEVSRRKYRANVDVYRRWPKKVSSSQCCGCFEGVLPALLSGMARFEPAGRFYVHRSLATKVFSCFKQHCSDFGSLKESRSHHAATDSVRLKVDIFVHWRN